MAIVFSTQKLLKVTLRPAGEMDMILRQAKGHAHSVRVLKIDVSQTIDPILWQSSFDGVKRKYIWD